MLSILALLGTFLLLPLVAQAQEYTITINQVEHATITAYYIFAGQKTIVKNGDQVSRNKRLRVQATPDEGYVVTHYIINDVEKENLGNEYSEFVTSDLTISARVAPATLHTVTITQPEHGTLKVTDGGKEVTSGDQKYFGTRLSFELTPETGYEIEYWIVNGKKNSPSTRAGFENKGSLTVREDVTVTAQLKEAGTKTMVPVTLVKPEHATVKAYKGRSTYSPELAAGEQVEAGSEILVVVTPEAGYGVDYWLFNDQRVERSPYTPNEYTFRIIEASTITPVLKEAGYKITYEQPAEGGTLSVKAGYGSSAQTVVSGSRVEERASLKIEATVEAGYQFKHFLINGKVKTVTNPRFPYLYETATEDMTIAAVIEKLEPSIVTITPFDHGTLTVKYGTYSSPTIVANGEEVPMNTNLTLEAKVDPAYEFKHFLINGVETPHTYYSDYFKTYSCNYMVTGPVTIAVVAVEKPSTVITIDPFEHGELVVKYGMYPNSVEVKSGDAVPQGETISVDAFFDDGYGLDHFLVNGESKPSDDTEDDYILLTVGDTPLKLSAVAKKTHGLIVMVQPDATQGTMTAHYTDDAEKAVTDGMSVEKGVKITFVVTPQEGYEMASWKVNDETKELESADPNQLTLPVNDNLKVEPVLKEKAAPQPTMYTVQMIQPKESQGTMTAHYTDDATQAVTDGMSVEKGVKVTFVVTPKEGYEMESWKVNDETKELESADPNQLTLLVNDNTKVEPVLKAKAPVNPTEATLTITREGTGATISGKYVTPDEMTFSIWEGNTKQVPLGSKVTLTADLTEGFEVTYMNNGNPAPAEALSEEGKVYTFIVQGDVTVVAKVTEKQVAGEFTVTCIADPEEGGKVSASTAEGPITNGGKVAGGEYITVKATPEENFEVDQWFVNGTELTYKKGYSSFTFLLAEDVTIRVTFKSTLPPPEYAVTVEPTLPSAEAGNVQLFQKNGTPFESGKSVVTGTEMYVEVTPADKYELEMLQVGETKLPAGDEKLVNIAGGGVKYTFTVTAATKVQATFKLSKSIEQLAQGGVAVFVTNGGTRLEIAGAAEGTEVRLYDYTGQLLLASTEQTLDISALPAGSYIVLVGDYTTRIVK